MRARLLALALLLALPSACALDALPDATRLGAHDAGIIVRVATGASLRVDADAPLLVGLVGNASLAPTPAVLAPPANASWHGMPGVVELRLHRADAGSPVEVLLDDGSGAGAAVPWPAVRPTPGLGPTMAVGALVMAAALCTRRRTRDR